MFGCRRALNYHTSCFVTQQLSALGRIGFATKSSIAASRLQAPNKQSFGAFAHVPKVPTPEELVEVGTARANRLFHDKFISGEKSKAQDHALRKLSIFTDYAMYRLGKCVTSSISESRLHPFERTVMGLSLGPDVVGRVNTQTEQPPAFNDPRAKWDESNRSVDVGCTNSAYSNALEMNVESGLREYRQVMQSLIKVQKNLETLYQTHSRIIRACQTRREVHKADEAAYRALTQFITSQQTRNAFEQADAMFTRLRRLNVLNPALPTVALVGCPNVGKSTLVSLLSTAKPEMQNFPFTTRSVLVGHLTLDEHIVQVADTPGLLNRSDNERKKIELLTLSVLEHVPDLIVVFVLDPTGYCGTSLEDQLMVRQELRYRYGRIIPPNRWFDIVTKTDIWRQDKRFRGANLESVGAQVWQEYEESQKRTQDADESEWNLSNVQRIGKQKIRPTLTSTPPFPCDDTVPPDWDLTEALARINKQLGLEDVLDEGEDCYAFTIASIDAYGISMDTVPIAESLNYEVGTPKWAMLQGKLGLAEFRNALGWELLNIIEHRQRRLERQLHAVSLTDRHECDDIQ